MIRVVNTYIIALFNFIKPSINRLPIEVKVGVGVEVGAGTKIYLISLSFTSNFYKIQLSH